MTSDLAPTLRPGDVIADKYRIESIIGAGGMGVVLAGTHIALRQEVAIKLLLPAALKLPNAGERFLREAQATVAIRSEHVVRVLDLGTCSDGAPYMVMERLTGTDLGRLLKERGRLELVEAISYMLQTIDAVAEAHSLGIVHRDLKPSNLFLTRRSSGEAFLKVLDFGLSKMQLEGDVADNSLTATDVVAGSPYYMSPEQLRSLKNVDPRTDVWSLGVILHELLAGKRPFEGPSVTAICASVVADTPMSLCTLRSDIPEALSAVLSRCLEKNPDRRMQSARELALALMPFGAPTPRCPPLLSQPVAPPVASSAPPMVVTSKNSNNEAPLKLQLPERSTLSVEQAPFPSASVPALSQTRSSARRHMLPPVVVISASLLMFCSLGVLARHGFLEHQQRASSSPPTEDPRRQSAAANTTPATAHLAPNAEPSAEPNSNIETKSSAAVASASKRPASTASSSPRDSRRPSAGSVPQKPVYNPLDRPF